MAYSGNFGEAVTIEWSLFFLVLLLLLLPVYSCDTDRKEETGGKATHDRTEGSLTVVKHTCLYTTHMGFLIDCT